MANNPTGSPIRASCRCHCPLPLPVVIARCHCPLPLPVAIQWQSRINHSDIRTRNLTTTNFDVRIQEWEYLDGWHDTESASYVVVESAIHTLAGFQAEPLLIAAIQSFDGTDTANLGIANLNPDGAQVWVDEQRSSDYETNHPTEAVGILALARGTILSQNNSDENGNESAAGTTGNSESSNMAVSQIRYLKTDGPLGKAAYLAPGHTGELATPANLIFSIRMNPTQATHHMLPAMYRSKSRCGSAQHQRTPLMIFN